MASSIYKTVVSNIPGKSYLAKHLAGRNRGRGGLILGFHEISYNPLNSILDQVSNYYDFVSLSQLVARLNEGKSTSGLAAITFDDGFDSVVTSASQLAARNGWPMTFFLPVRFLDNQEVPWFHTLKPLLESATWDRLELDGLIWSRGKGQIDGVVKSIGHRFLAASSYAQVEKLLDQLWQSVTGSIDRSLNLSVPKLISWQGVQMLAGREELCFESHSVNHLVMNIQSEEDIRSEMAQSRTRVEEHTGRQVRHYCYPFGGSADIGKVAPLVAAGHYDSAVTMIRGRCHGAVNPFMLPRIPLYEEDSEEVVALKMGLAR